MPPKLKKLEQNVRNALANDFREKLLARGQARSIIWREGVLPQDAPPFSPLLTYDLLSYGYALLNQSLRIVDANGDLELARIGCAHAAEAIEAVIAKGEENDERDFHRFVAAAAYHCGRYSARAYSLLRLNKEKSNHSTCEYSLCLLMLRDLDELNSYLINWRLEKLGTDETIIELLSKLENEADIQGDNEDIVGRAIDIAMTDNFVGALAEGMLAFDRGEVDLLERAKKKLDIGLKEAAASNLVPQWWCHRLAIHLLGDLWDTSFHTRLPVHIPGSAFNSKWGQLREIFIASLYRRDKAEIELWPSQIGAVSQVMQASDNLVVSLPTSAGKTRIAELCILLCLAQSKRIVFVTPLRALSSQTEVSLRRTFHPLGKTVSNLYGSIGVSEVDENLLKTRNIIVSTPEKLDFAIRNDSSLLDDVGLIILDEGHMIGLGEREVRYEVQIQKLLKRKDSASRRLVCLSAILPEGDQLTDFVAWLTTDNPNGLIERDWRPTRLRFGELAWNGDNAQLNIQVGDERPFIPKFVVASIPKKGRRKTPFPKDQRELCLAAAWRLIEEGQTVLIFCPLRVSVEPYARSIVDLNKRGILRSVLEQENSILTALTIGAEWFGDEHPILECLKLGVAIHHGTLPTPFRREIEKLLREGVLKVTVSSPTLAQGLNLSATTLLFHGLVRNGEVIESSEFRNIVGRAGRAFVDLEGLVLYPIFDDHHKRRADWKSLIADDGGRLLESGLLRLLATLLQRMQAKIQTKDLNKLINYVANNSAWTFSELPMENPKKAQIEAERWRNHLTSLDTAILSLLGDQDIQEDQIEIMIDEMLQSSLWERRIRHRTKPIQAALKAGFVARTRYVWKNSTPLHRKGYFLSGVGLDTGKALDEASEELENFLIKANGFLIAQQSDLAVNAITDFAEIIFKLDPFIPDDLPANWKDILNAWLRGESIAEIKTDDKNELLHFIEHALVYKLPWGMEAVRVRGLAHNRSVDEFFHFSDFDLTLAVAAVETGTLDKSASVLMRHGFSSRSGAIKAVSDTAASFDTSIGLQQWVESEAVKKLEQDDFWPTMESANLWREFKNNYNSKPIERWKSAQYKVRATWHSNPPQDKDALRIVSEKDGRSIILGADCEILGTLAKPINPSCKGLLKASATAIHGDVILDYVGPNDLFEPLS